MSIEGYEIENDELKEELARLKKNIQVLMAGKAKMERLFNQAWEMIDELRDKQKQSKKIITSYRKEIAEREERETRLKERIERRSR